MTILVMNCFHWMSYHIVKQLLENGYQVDGIASEKNAMQEHLSMFLGRNSNFELKTVGHLDVYDTAITMGTCTAIDEINANRQFHITREEIEEQPAKTVMVHVPLLFGEWMPMNEEGMFVGEQFFRFDSNYFQTKAIYIEDFVLTLLQWLETEDLPDQLEMRTQQTAANAAACKNIVYLRKNKTNKERVTQILSHYRRFQSVYEQER